MAFAALKRKRLVNGIEYFGTHGLSLSCGNLCNLAQVFENHDKFIAPQARHCVDLANAACDPLGCLLQHEVADVMTKRVVQGLESVQVHKEQCVFAAAPDAGNQGLAQPLPKQTPVWQAGQGVIEGQIPNLLFVGFGLKNIAHEGENAGDSFNICEACRELSPEDLA